MPKRTGAVLLSALLAATSTVAPAQIKSIPPAYAILPDTAEAAGHVAAATALAGDDFKTPLFLCRPDSINVVRDASQNGTSQWAKPVRLFDNLYFVGNRFVGSFVLKTNKGLILFDAGMGPDDVRDHIVPGLISLGLNPKDLRYAIVTHGHRDHFGGGLYLQQTYNTRVGLSAADWDLIALDPAAQSSAKLTPPPRRDLVIEDGQKLVLGDTTIILYVTPGHTPGTVSAIVPVKDHGETRIFSLLGSTAFPASIEPTPRVGGLKAYENSVTRFAKISADAGATGLLNTHGFADGTLERIDAATAKGWGTPLIVGAGGVARYYGLLRECLEAAEARAAAAATKTN